MKSIQEDCAKVGFVDAGSEKTFRLMVFQFGAFR